MKVISFVTMVDGNFFHLAFRIHSFCKYSQDHDDDYHATRNVNTR